jgi:hypothetical protein
MSRMRDLTIKRTMLLTQKDEICRRLNEVEEEIKEITKEVKDNEIRGIRPSAWK